MLASLMMMENVGVAKNGMEKKCATPNQIPLSQIPKK